MMGVDYELFWTLNPMTLSPFIKAFDLIRKNQDTLAWQSGLYVRMAVASLLGKDEYPKSPLLTKADVKEKPMSPEEIKSRVMARMNIINSQF